MTKTEAIDFWIKSAKDNLKTVDAMIHSKHWNFAMFMCQQSLEAILKAIFIHKAGERPPHIHKLPQLVNLCGIELPKDIDFNILEIDAHYIKARYFSDRFDTRIYNKRNATSLYKNTKEAFRWLIKSAGLKI